jgi:tetratricopeptide (TPR) repeat protein
VRAALALTFRQHARAAGLYARAAEADPTWAKPPLLEARLWAKRGADADALRCFRQALAIDAAVLAARRADIVQAVTVILRRADVLARGGRADVARDLYAELFALDLTGCPAELRLEVRRRHDRNGIRSAPSLPVHEEAMVG